MNPVRGLICGLALLALQACGGGTTAAPIGPVAPLRVTFLGDSQFQRWDVRGQFPEWNTTNAGIGGNKSSQMLARLAPLLATRPDVLVLIAGTNDVYYLGEQTGTDDLQTIVNQGNAAGAAVFVFTVPPIMAPSEPHDVRPWNDKVRQLQGAVILDLYAHTVKDGKPIEGGLLPDGQHVGPKGYEIAAQLLRGSL